MRKALGYALIILGVLGFIGIAIFLAYWLLIIAVWCPLSNCLPQVFVILILGCLALGACVFSFRKGTKLISRRKSA